MLRLNASVHSWLTRQEMKLAKARELRATIGNVSALAAADQTTDTDGQRQQRDLATAASDSATQMSAEDHPPSSDEEELHKQLKNEVGEMYSVWDEADARFVHYISYILIGVCV